MSGHTPGPWETRIGAADQVFAVGGCRICTVMTKHDEPHRVFDEDVANARLIAAAPELLDFAKAFVKWVEIGTPADHYDMAKAAIAKATGAQS